MVSFDGSVITFTDEPIETSDKALIEALSKAEGVEEVTEKAKKPAAKAKKEEK